MTSLNEIVSYTNSLLDINAFRDYGPNGLQIEGRPEIKTLVSGVTASQALIEAAVDAGADALLVHHGYFWKGEDPCIVGIKKQRIARLLDTGMSLLAYHLPLDAHPELGNNVCLAKELGFLIKGTFGTGVGPDIAFHGELAKPLSGNQLIDLLTKRLGREPLHIAGHSDAIKTIGWCSGGAQGMIELAAKQGFDAYLTGEVSEQTVHIARETGIHFYAAGHHATERYGAPALGEHLAKQFGLSHKFIEIDNPA
ncbi:MAG: Nif3-like dinuclear metal center hexameric protein [Gammaproteobacteria bacterium]|nr:Nif3-like dinuclear metal center hexameric protein [Gammaproteobacteria bacterium]